MATTFRVCEIRMWYKILKYTNGGGSGLELSENE